MSATQPGRDKLVLVMVGLPARGKSYVARKLERYLNWLGHPTRVFNVGSYRRAHVGERMTHEFFDPDNAAARALRLEMARRALDDMDAWLQGEGRVGIYDATNTTAERRRMLLERFEARAVRVVFVESVCEAPGIIEANIRATKLLSPDYAGMDPNEAVADFRQRIEHYRRCYEPVADEALSFVKLVDAGRQVIVNRIEGYLPARIVAFLVNLHPSSRTIWLVRHGESWFNLEGRIGGDSELSPGGRVFAENLARAFEEQHRAGRRLHVWTSTMRRTLHTAAALPWPALAWRALDEIDAGECDGMTYEEIRANKPAEWAARDADKLRYRYPRGESYEDVIVRLDPLIVELERTERAAIIIGHQAALRALYAYLIGEPAARCPYLEIPLHTLIELRPNAYGCDERRAHLGPPPATQQAARSGSAGS
jgi:broad specificity phosphatase PhoE/predicted kinase